MHTLRIIISYKTKAAFESYNTMVLLLDQYNFYYYYCIPETNTILIKLG